MNAVEAHRMRMFTLGVAVLFVVAGPVIGKLLHDLNDRYESDGWTSEVIHPVVKESDGSYSIRLPHLAPPFIADPNLTPGSYFKQATLEKIKQPNYSATIRNVTEADKKRIAAAYGIPWSEHDKYEFDHKIPASLGGDNSDNNIYPEPLQGKYGALVKDLAEREALPKVRSGEWDLQETRAGFANDWWTDIYQKLHPGESPKTAIIRADEQ